MQKIRQDIPLGSNLRKLRNSAGLTQEQVVSKLVVAGSAATRSQYSRYETGELNIRASDLILLKDIFKCSYDDFFVVPEL